MSYKRLAFVIAFFVLTGCGQLPDRSGSYRQQLGQINQMRDLGAISEQEYQSQRSRVFHVMLH